MDLSHATLVRNSGIKKSVFAGFLGKGLGYIVNMAIVPISLKYLGRTEYGIWVTLASMLLWLNFFDLGFGLGLQNYLTTAIANGDEEKSKKLVSSVFFGLCSIAGILFIIGMIAVYAVSWSRVFSAPVSLDQDLRLVVAIVLVIFIFQFPLSMMNAIYSAYQQKYKQIYWMTAGSLASLISVYILTRFEGGMVNLAIASSGSLLFVRIINALYVYGIWKKELRPRWHYFDFAEIRNMAALSLSFMGLQLAAIISYQTDNFIILKILGPDTVTQYSVAQRLFSMLIMFLTLVGNPFWPAITDAYARRDLRWIRKAFQKLQTVTIVFLLPLIAVILLFGPFIMKFWLGNADYFSFDLFLLLSILTLSMGFQSIYSYLMNGCSKPAYLVRVTYFTIPVYIFLAIILIHLFGLTGFVISKIIINSFIILVVQVYFVHRRILNEQPALAS